MLKKFIRSLIAVLCTIIFGIGAAFISFVLFPIGFLFGKNKRKYFTSIIHYSWKIFTKILNGLKIIKIDIKGDIKNIKGKIIVASHPSLIDIVLLIGMIPKSTCVAKNELLKNPILFNIVKNAFIVNDTEEFITESKKLLEEGYNIIIFPTGTRTTKDEDIKIHKGAAQLAIKTVTSIIPVKIECDTEFLPKNKSLLDIGENTANFTLTVKDEINCKDFTEPTEIKLRKAISEKIKENIS